MNIHLNKWLKKINQFEQILLHLPSVTYYGHLIGLNGLILEVCGLKLPIGTICIVEKMDDTIIDNIIEAEVVGFKRDVLFLIPLSDISGIVPLSKVTPKIFNGVYYNANTLPICDELLGRVLDGDGNPLDNLSIIDKKYNMSLTNVIINPLYRAPIVDVLDTGIRVINALLTIGKGQKVGLFSSSGLGKSVLLGMMTRYTQADIVVVSLVGERSREVREFIDSISIKNILSRSIVISSPAEFSVLKQVRGAVYAMRIAEYFRDKNCHVLFIMDSLTRYAMAHRTIALSMGELPSNKGYPPSVFSKLLSLIERAGNGKQNSGGSITAFFTVLTEPDEKYDPISEVARSILDGHIILSRKYAESGHYPAINIKRSISRVMPKIVKEFHYSQACRLKKMLSCYQQNIDLINVGAYVSGTNLDLDVAIKLLPRINNFLQQAMSDKINFLSSRNSLYELFR